MFLCSLGVSKFRSTAEFLFSFFLVSKEWDRCYLPHFCLTAFELRLRRNSVREAYNFELTCNAFSYSSYNFRLQQIYGPFIFFLVWPNSAYCHTCSNSDCTLNSLYTLMSHYQPRSKLLSGIFWDRTVSCPKPQRLLKAVEKPDTGMPK